MDSFVSIITLLLCKEQQAIPRMMGASIVSGISPGRSSFYDASNSLFSTSILYLLKDLPNEAASPIT